MLSLLLCTLPAGAQTFNPSGPEGNSGVTFLDVVFTQSSPGNLPVTGNYQTVDGTATVADNDYLPASGTFIIPPGETDSQPIRIGIVGDTKFESNETFRLVISNVQGGTLTNPGPYTFTIQNDDTQPTIAVSSPSVAEGNGGGFTPLSFVITLGAPAGTSVPVTWSIAAGSASFASDFIAAPSGSFVFAPGETQRTVNVEVVADNLFEDNETFTLTATATGGNTATGTATIVNDDPRPAAAVGILSGNNQSGRLGLQLAQPLVVRVVDSTGAPVRGVTVTWSVTSGAAQLSPAASTTDADGRATTTVVVNSVGPITIQATVAGLAPATFTINATTSFESRAQGPVAVPVARALDTLCARNEQEFTAVCRALSLLSDAEFSPSLERLAPQQSGAQSKVASEVVSAVTSGIAARLSAVRGGVQRFSTQQLQIAINDRPLPLAALAAAFGPQEATDAGGSEEDPYSGWSAFLSGNLGTGERNARDGQLGFDLESQGVMFGVDRLVGQNIFGASLHLMQLDADLSGGNGTVDTSGYSLSLYGSRGGLFAGGAPNSKFDGLHFDGSLTYGRNTYEAERDLTIAGITVASATSENDANVFAIAAGTGFEAHTGRTDFDLTLGGTWSRADISELSEQGTGPLLLFVQGQDIESLTANLGLNVRAAFPVPFGTLLPSLRGEYVRELKDDARLVTARFLRDRLGTTFTVPLDRPDASYGRIGAGLQALFPFGWSATVEATQDVLRSDLKFRNLQFNVYKSF
ncbi:MAG TPA: autotransporter domain-containing protein [Thermoanaerobaculia bacterium]|nr:autotransporter domain-containing protein [Thermoanaerobaculia bacterium]